jgi:hypothetical protein
MILSEAKLLATTESRAVLVGSATIVVGIHEMLDRFRCVNNVYIRLNKAYPQRYGPVHELRAAHVDTAPWPPKEASH